MVTINGGSMIFSLTFLAINGLHSYIFPKYIALPIIKDNKKIETLITPLWKYTSKVLQPLQVM